MRETQSTGTAILKNKPALTTLERLAETQQKETRGIKLSEDDELSMVRASPVLQSEYVRAKSVGFSTRASAYPTNASALRHPAAAKQLEPQVLALDLNESYEIDSNIQRARMKHSNPAKRAKLFVKQLSRVTSKVDSFYSKASRDESMKKAGNSALTAE